MKRFAIVDFFVVAILLILLASVVAMFVVLVTAILDLHFGALGLFSLSEFGF